MYGQTFPVTGTVQVKAPYSVFLSDYTKIEEDKLIINLKLNDPVDPVRDVKLRIKMESQTVTLETNPSFIPTPLTLNNGFMERFTGADISEYFLANNLQFTRGLTRQEFQRRGAIPEGLYKVCIEVYDYTSGNKISLPICAQAWIILNDPPRLILPENNSIVKANDPQNLPFRWMPMNGGSPNSFFQTEYEFSLYEIWPATRNPNDAVNTTPPILQETTNTPVYFYSIADPFLVPGRKYAWRVKARDAGGLDMFKNQGYSEVFSFVWGVECNIPLGISSEVLSSDRTKTMWDERDNATEYVVRYREKGNTGVWYEVKTSSVNAFLTGTKGETEYEYQVRCECSGIAGQFSSLNYFTTPKAGDYLQKLNCNDQNKPPVITNKNPLVRADKGDELRVGLFTVTLTEVSGANGVFSGKGRVNVALINAEVIAEFRNVKVNTDKQVYEGELVIKSVGASLIPPELRDKIKERLAEVDKYLQQLEKYAPDADNALKISKDVLGQIDDILKDVGDALKRDSIEGRNPGGGWQVNLQLGNFRDKIKDGFDWIAKGDTIKGKNLIAQGLNGIKDLIGAGGQGLIDLGNAIVNGDDLLKELIKKLLGEIKGTNKDSVSSKSEKIARTKKDRDDAIAKINEKNKRGIGDFQETSMQTSYYGSPIELELTEDQIRKLSSDPNYKTYFENDDKVFELEKAMVTSGLILLMVNEIITNEELLKELVEDVRKNLKDDFLKMGANAIEEAFKGKNPDLENKIRIYLNTRISDFITRYNSR